MNKKVALLAAISIVLQLAACATSNSPIFAHGQTYTNITSDTVWTADKSPYIISSSQAIAQNSTLTIEPGVTVKSIMNWAGQKALFLLVGNLVAVGTADAPITFEFQYSGGQLVAAFGEPSAYFSYCNFKNCPDFWQASTGGQGHFTLTNSNVEGSWVDMYPSDNVYIQNNVFTNCLYFRFHILSSNEQVYLQNNLVIKDSANLQRYPYMFVIDNGQLNPNGTVTNLNNETNMAPNQTIPPAPTPLPTPTNTPTPNPTVSPQTTPTTTPSPTATTPSTQSPSPTQTPSASPSAPPTLSPSPSVPEFPAWTILPLAGAIVVVVLVCFKRRKSVIV